MSLLDGKIAVVTGAASENGIGKAIAQLFAEHGARIVITDLSAQAAAATAAQLPVQRGGGPCA